MGPIPFPSARGILAMLALAGIGVLAILALLVVGIIWLIDHVTIHA